MYTLGREIVFFGHRRTTPLPIGRGLKLRQLRIHHRYRRTTPLPIGREALINGEFPKKKDQRSVKLRWSFYKFFICDTVKPLGCYAVINNQSPEKQLRMPLRTAYQV